MGKKLLFVYNPRSGRGLIKQNLAEIIDVLTKGGYDVIAHPTQAAGDARETFARMAGEVDTVVCSGGDGTMDEVVDAVMKYAPAMPVGYIPAGSTNDFANSLAISKNMVEAAEDIVVGDIYQCDVGAFNDKHFIYVAAFGMFTNVSYETDQTLKNNLGHLAYVLEAGKQLFNIPSYHIMVDADGRKVEGNYAYGMITNSRLVGGMKNITGRAVDMNDGLFEVTLVHTPTNPIEVNEIIQALLNGAETSLVEKVKAKRVTIDSAEEIAWTLDGEYGEAHTHVEIENRHKELQLFLNRRKPVKLVSPNN
uniref:DAGKc domain-containing protein n=1 Tax=Eubacterium cellulosolvens (strain ATCC 43171 / JCM 9499 / 6) TaxID=633697 RepID=I5AVX6_EUBC6